MSQVNALWQKYKLNNDLKAREQIILEYAYLAKYVVGRLNLKPSASLAYDDLVSYAVIGLIEAVERFDLAREVKFETYAITRIKGSVLDALKSLDWLPRSVRNSEMELRRVMGRLEAELGRVPSDAEIAEEMGVTIDHLGEIIASSGQAAMLSLEELMLAGEDYTSDSGLGICADLGCDPFRAAELEERKSMLARAIGDLPEREKLVISLYYKEGLTLKEIAQVLSVTESRACQLHSKAVIRLNGKLSRHSDLMLAVA